MGKCISIEGDVNGDGYSDVLVGQHQYSPPSDQGRALFYGGPSESAPHQAGHSPLVVKSQIG